MGDAHTFENLRREKFGDDADVCAVVAAAVIRRH
jgi:hypothetical protein